MPNSYLDALLFVTNDAQDLIAGNDQNGLFNQNDAFIRVELPADGTYYLVLSDPYTGGGTNYKYYLHIVLP